MARQSSKAPPGAISNDGRLDPAKVDIAKRRPGKRKLRNRPDPSPELVAWADGAERRLMARPHPPGIMLEPGFDDEHWTSPHADVDIWRMQLGEAFGTRSVSVMTLFLRQLQALCSKDHWDENAKQWRLDEKEFSAALAMVSAIKPKNEMEAALAAQMVAVHLMQMKLSAHVMQDNYDTKTAAVAGKLARTFTLQLEALQAIKGKRRTTRQIITVKKELHQSIHYHDHKGSEENERQPHKPTATTTGERSAMPCEEPRGRALRLPSRKRQAGV